MLKKCKTCGKEYRPVSLLNDTGYCSYDCQLMGGLKSKEDKFEKRIMNGIAKGVNKK